MDDKNYEQIFLCGSDASEGTMKAQKILHRAVLKKINSHRCPID
jgi:hypothetical protein